MRSQQWHPCGSSSHCWWHRPAASADAPKALTASPNDNELLAPNVFQACVWPHGHDKCEPLPPANTSARPADTPYGQCKPAAVTAVVATQLSMQLKPDDCPSQASWGALVAYTSGAVSGSKRDALPDIVVWLCACSVTECGVCSCLLRSVNSCLWCHLCGTDRVRAC